jgi:hypothetical protein
VVGWRPAGPCVIGHRITVRAIRHLRTEVLIPEAEPVVLDTTVMMEAGQEEVEVRLGTNLTACVLHRIEVRN